MLSTTMSVWLLSMMRTFLRGIDYGARRSLGLTMAVLHVSYIPMYTDMRYQVSLYKAIDKTPT